MRFWSPVAVAPKQSARWFIQRRRGKTVRGFRRDRRVERNAQQLAAYARQHAPAAPLAGPLRLRLIVVSAPRVADRNEAGANWACWRWRDSKPDLDNLTKQICDVLEHCGYFAVGDQQVVELSAMKCWHARGPGVLVELERIDPWHAADQLLEWVP